MKKTKADIVAFLCGVAVVLVGRFVLSDQTKEAFIGLSLQGFSYILGLIMMVYAVLPKFGEALFNRLGFKLKSKTDAGCEDSDPPPPKTPHKR